MESPPPGTPIILDIGSAYVKVGFAGDSTPRYVFPCITGTEKYKAVMVDVGPRSIYVGDDAMKMRGVLKVSYPIQRGQIMDWNTYYEVLNHIFYNLLRVENLSLYPVVYAEHPFVQREVKEYIARVLFETHRIKSLMMIPSALFSIFSVGLTTGLVVESGDGITWIVPVINGKIFYQAVQRVELGGADVNHNLKNLMMREGINITSSSADEILRQIKEKNCYFVLDPRNPPISSESLSYPMPDGNTISIPNRLLFQAPEVLFTPAMIGSNVMSIPQAIIYCLKTIGSEYWGEMLQHIVLSGGNLSYSGFADRLKNELSALLPELGPIPKPRAAKPSVIAPAVETKKLQLVGAEKREKDTCSKCGTLVDLTDGKQFCPSCGAPMALPEITIGIDLGKKQEKPKKNRGKCPNCGKDVKDNASLFCPYCGKTIPAELEVPDVATVEHILEKAPEVGQLASYFESSEDVIKLFIPDSLQYAIFNGASILGSLPSFQPLFVTLQQFQADPNQLYRDISDIISQ